MSLWNQNTADQQTRTMIRALQSSPHTYGITVDASPRICTMTSSIDNSKNDNPSPIDADASKAEEGSWEQYVPKPLLSFAHDTLTTMEDSRLFNNFSIHPGHFLMVTSLPFCFSAYRNYHKPLESIVNEVLLKRTEGKVKIADLKLAEGSIRRVVGSALAARALRVSGAASVGFFGVAWGLAFYATGCQTLQEAVVFTRGWAGDTRRGLDRAFGIEGRIDANHAESQITKNMTEEEEMAHISKTYFPVEEWGDEDWGEEEEKPTIKEVVSK
jgi:hypothetical protein